MTNKSYESLPYSFQTILKIDSRIRLHGYRLGGGHHWVREWLRTGVRKTPTRVYRRAYFSFSNLQIRNEQT